MKYTTMVKSALAVVLGLAVGSASAAETAVFSDDFEEYEAGTPITGLSAKWWNGGEDDTSAVLEIDGNNVLNLNTEGGTVSNKFAKAEDRDALNGSIAGAGIALDAKVQFVASDDDKTIPEGDDLKFALFAYSEGEENSPTNLVITHGAFDENGTIVKTNTLTSIAIDCSVLTPVKVVMKKFTGTYGDLKAPVAFQVTVGTTLVTDANAYTEDALATAYTENAGGDGASWFLTASMANPEQTAREAISALALKGTGKVDDIALSTIQSEVYFFQVGNDKYTEAQDQAAFTAAFNNEASITFLEDYTITNAVNLSNGFEFGEDVSITIASTATVTFDITTYEYTDLNAWLSDYTYPISAEKDAQAIAAGATWTYDGTEWTKPEATIVIIAADESETPIYADGLAGLNDAIAAASAGSTIKLNADVAYNLVVPAGSTLILDLNGHTISNSANNKYTVDNLGTLTVIDSSDEKTGMITHFTDDPAVTTSTIRNLGALEISDITVAGNYIGIKNDEGNGCNGGKGYGELVLNGVKFCGDDQAVQNWGKAVINGGVFMNEVFTWADNANQGNVAGETIINDGIFSNNVAAANWYRDNAWPTAEAKVVISGGVFEAKVYGTYTTNYTGEEPNRGDIVVPALVNAELNGAKFAEKPVTSVTLDEGYEFALLDGYYKVQEVVVPPTVIRISGGVETGYQTLAEAVAAAQNGDTIKMVVDYTLAADEEVSFSNKVALDLNEKALTIRGSKTAFVVAAGADVSLTNGVITWPNSAYGIQVKGSVTVDACAITNPVGSAQGPVFDMYGATSKVIVNSGSIAGDADIFRLTKDDNAKPTVIINGGTFWDKAYYGTFYVYKNGCEADIVLNGGTFENTGSMFKLANSAVLTVNHPFTDSCKAKFKSVTDLAPYIASGYETVLGQDGYYTIQKVASPVATVITVAGADPVEYTDLHQALVDGSAAGSVVELIADVDLTGVEWVPVANFLGKFDGKGHKISNLTIDVEGGNAGLFGSLDWGKNHAGICNLVISNADVKATGSNVGVLAAKNGSTGCVISNVTVCGSISVIGSSYVGGLVGHNQYSHIIDCHVIGDGAATSVIGYGEINEGVATGSGQIGGLVGMTGEGNMHIWNCSVEKVSVKGSGLVGAIWGRMHDSSKMVGCTATDVDVYCAANVETAEVKIGTLVGGFVGGGLAPVINCTATNVKLYTLDGTSVPTRWTGTVADGKNVAIGTGVEGDALAFRFSNPQLTAGTFEVKSDAAVTALTGWCAEGYAPIANQDGTYTIGIPPPAPAFPSYIDPEDADQQAAYTTWATGKTIDDAEKYEAQFLMNVDPSVDVLTGIKITSIAVGDTIVVEVESNIDNLSLANINGNVILKGAASLGSDWTQIGPALEVTDGKAVYSGQKNEYKFFKAFVVNPYQKPASND